MDSKIFNKYKTAADILNNAIKLAKNMIIPNTKIYDISSACDEYIKLELGKTYKNLKKGLALPTCISVNQIVCHYSPDSENDYQLKKDDIVRIEMACYIEEYVVSTGETLQVENNSITELDEMKAAKLALSTGLKMIEPFMETKKFDNIIKEIAQLYGLELLERPYVFNEADATLAYDWVKRDDHKFLEQSWVVKCDQELDLEDLRTFEEEKYEKDTHFNIGDIYHLEVAFCKTNKSPIISDTRGTLFQKTYIRHGLKSKYAREICTYVGKNIGNYFFKLSDLEMSPTQARVGISEAKRHHVFRELGIIEKKDCPIIRLKCSIAIMENTVYLLTGKENIITKDIDNKLTPELLKIFQNNPKFSKRDAPVLTNGM